MRRSIRRRSKSSLSASPFDSPAGFDIGASLNISQDIEFYPKIAARALKITASSGECGLKQVRGLDAQYVGQLRQDFETRVARTFFEFADIGAVHVGVIREVLLRYTFGIITSNTARPMVALCSAVAF